MDCWHHEIDTATTEKEIVRNAGDYLVLWAPRDLEPINLGLAEMRIETPDDVERVNRWLGDSTLVEKLEARNSFHVRELAQYFSHACARIGQIRRGYANLRPMA
jgi:hypothetical protein